MNRIEEIETRMAEIADELENDGVNIDALETEVRSLKAEKAQIMEAAEKRHKLKAEVARGDAGSPVQRPASGNMA